jgi:hypothetical protein
MQGMHGTLSCECAVQVYSSVQLITKHQDRPREDSLPVVEIPHGERGEVGRVVDLRDERRPLPLQHVLVLRLGPRVEPQDLALDHARVRGHARLAVLVHRGPEGWSLGDELADAGAVEAPAVVHALEPALVVDAPLGERREAVRARVVEHAPLAGAAVVPGDHAEPEHRLPVRRARVEVAHGRERVPLVQPVERVVLLQRRRRLLLPRCLGRRGGHRPGDAAPPSWDEACSAQARPPA